MGSEIIFQFVVTIKYSLHKEQMSQNKIILNFVFCYIGSVCYTADVCKISTKLYRMKIVQAYLSMDSQDGHFVSGQELVLKYAHSKRGGNTKRV